MTDREINQIIKRIDDMDKTNKLEHKELRSMLIPLVKEDEYRRRLEKGIFKGVKFLAVIVGMIVSILGSIKLWAEIHGLIGR